MSDEMQIPLHYRRAIEMLEARDLSVTEPWPHPVTGEPWVTCTHKKTIKGSSFTLAGIGHAESLDAWVSQRVRNLE